MCAPAFDVSLIVLQVLQGKLQAAVCQLQTVPKHTPFTSVASPTPAYTGGALIATPSYLQVPQCKLYAAVCQTLSDPADTFGACAQAASFCEGVILSGVLGAASFGNRNYYNIKARCEDPSDVSRRSRDEHVPRVSH